MVEDATFEEGGEAPLRLRAFDSGDLEVISSFIQDAIFPITEMVWDRPRRRFAILLNRFRWEDVPAAERRGREFERVQAMLVVEDVLKVATQGVDRSERETVLSILSIGFVPGEEGSGRLELVLAGDGAVALEVEALEVVLRDVTRPYRAVSGKVPDHPD